MKDTSATKQEQEEAAYYSGAYAERQATEPTAEQAPEHTRHTWSGNCLDFRKDQCYAHHQPRGKCPQCPPCPVCSKEAVGQPTIAPDVLEGLRAKAFRIGNDPAVWLRDVKDVLRRVAAAPNVWSEQPADLCDGQMVPREMNDNLETTYWECVKCGVGKFNDTSPHVPLAEQPAESAKPRVRQIGNAELAFELAAEIDSLFNIDDNLVDHEYVRDGLAARIFPILKEARIDLVAEQPAPIATGEEWKAVLFRTCPTCNTDVETAVLHRMWGPAPAEAREMLGNALYPGLNGDSPEGKPNTLWAFAKEAARRLTSSIDPQSLSAEQCAKIYSTVEWDGFSDWASCDNGKGIVPASNQTINISLRTAQVVAAFYISRGLVEVEK